jgi:hypothetical protein
MGSDPVLNLVSVTSFLKKTNSLNCSKSGTVTKISNLKVAVMKTHSNHSNLGVPVKP